MRKKPYQTHTLVDPQQALRVYLDALLCEVAFTDDEESTTAPTAEVDTQTDTPDDSLREAVEVPVATIETTEANPPEKKPTPKIILPDWAQTQFQCLSFQVAGVTLAAPLEKLDGIVELEQEITELPGYAPWVMGLLPNRGQNVQVVDIAQVIMPGGRQAETPPANERIKYVILVDAGRFGLAVDSLSQVLTIETDDVRWRSEQSKRPWLAGTIVDQMSAVLDIDRLTEQLVIGLNSSPMTDG